MQVGREIRRRRKALGWTLERLGEESHLSPHYLSTLENGKRDPSLSTLVRVAEALHLSLGELFEDESNNFSLETLEVAKLFEQAPPSIKEGILLILREVVILAKTSRSKLLKQRCASFFRAGRRK